jgi:outer membrane lipopolysaccharide assembly protein LptE/RlpB
MKRIFFLLVRLGLLLLSACGYTLVGQGSFPDHIETIAIPVFENDTLQEGAEEVITNAVIDQFIQRGRVQLVSETKADAILLGTVTTYRNKEAVTFNDQNQVSSYKLTVTVAAELKDLVEDTVLWETKGLSQDFDYKGGPDVGLTEERENELDALFVIADELAQKIRTLSTEGF